MPIPALLVPLLAESGGAIGAGAAAGGVGSAAGAAAGAAETGGLTKALEGILALGGGGGGGGSGGFTGYGLGGKTPQMPMPGMGLLGIAVDKLIKPITTLPKQIEDWGDSLLESRRNLMAFNGAIAGTLLEAERRDIVRKMGEGQRLSGSTDFLSEGLSDLKDEFQPLKDVIVNGFNLVAGTIIRGVTIGTQVVKWIPNIFNTLLAIQELLTARGDEEGAPFIRFIDDIRQGGLDDNDPNDNLMGPGI